MGGKVDVASMGDIVDVAGIATTPVIFGIPDMVGRKLI